MKFQANDHQALKEIADEIIMFEGIQHLNLIKYYGVEVHRVSDLGYSELLFNITKNFVSFISL